MINIFDLYTDYLQVSLGQATAIGLSKIVDNAVSHDQITRMLTNKDSDCKPLWLNVKSLVRQHESTEGGLIFYDSILSRIPMKIILYAGIMIILTVEALKVLTC